jgi:predicted short-subunit dehydrogenase-like oxidoreductase (DUF2520 family)
VSRPRPLPTAVIGTGKLAHTLAPLLDAAGFPIVAVSGRRGAAARELARHLAAARATTDPRLAASVARLVLLALPDDALEATARHLAGDRRIVWSERVVLHHAGSRGLEPLAPLARAGAAVGLLHPLQSLPRADLGAQVLGGSRARIEGDASARAVAHRVARALGLVPLRFRRPLAARDRVAYHAAASLVSNDVVALLALGVELLVASGAGRAAATEALVALARGTLAHASAAGPAGALTGPAARGDLGTLTAHWRRVRQSDSNAAEVHRLLSIQLARMAGGRPRGAPSARALERALSELGRARRG